MVRAVRQAALRVATRASPTRERDRSLFSDDRGATPERPAILQAVLSVLFVRPGEYGRGRDLAAELDAGDALSGAIRRQAGADG